MAAFKNNAMVYSAGKKRLGRKYTSNFITEVCYDLIEKDVKTRVEKSAYLENSSGDFEDRHVESAATQVVHRDRLPIRALLTAEREPTCSHFEFIVLRASSFR